MTTDNAKKKAVRARMVKTGESYTEALRLIEEEATAGATLTVSFHFEADCCANCDDELDFETQPLFCSELCREVAAFVRYARRLIVDPIRSADPLVKVKMQVRQAMIVGGGYPAKERHLSDSQRAFIIERDNGVCRECGEPANQIDHIKGSSPDPENLQLLCDPCHTKKTKSAMVPASKEQVAWIENLWQTRILVEVPTRLADHETEWDKQWRGLKALREHRLWEELEEETGFTKEDFRGRLRELEWKGIIDEAFDTNELPGKRYVETFEVGDPLPGGALEELEELWYFQDQMAKDD
jgi:Zn finger protein HypA/HybF involved in hydrogenase expression